MEQPPAPGVLHSRTVDPYLSDFAVLTAFALNAVCTPDVHLHRRLLAGPPGPAVHRMPRDLVTTTFDERLVCPPNDVEQFTRFVRQLLGLPRKLFKASMRAIRTYVTAMHRLADNLDVAYALLVASIEPLAQRCAIPPPLWDDYPENKRVALDKALGNADDQTRHDVRASLLKHENVSSTLRFGLFVQDHLEPTFFREEATGRTNPVGQSELHHCLRHAYSLRSKYLHGSIELPREFTLGPVGKAETVCVDGKTLLTFEGLSRVARHLIRRYVMRQKTVEAEPCDYSQDEPGVVRGRMAPEYWLGHPGPFSYSDGRLRLFAFCGQVSAGLSGDGPVTLTDIRQVLTQARSRFSTMKKYDRLPFLALYCLYNLVAPIDRRLDDNSKIVNQYRQELSDPSIEAMLLAMVTRTTPSWPLSEHREVHDAYFEGKERDKGLRLNALLEVGLTLELAERYRLDHDIGEARALIAFAVENHPGHQSLMRFEEGHDATEQIAWRRVMGLTDSEDTDDV